MQRGGGGGGRGIALLVPSVPCTRDSPAPLKASGISFPFPFPSAAASAAASAVSLPTPHPPRHRLRSFRSSLFHLHHPLPLLRAAAAVSEVKEAHAEGDEEPQPVGFVEVGYICNVHGLNGELRVKSTTDFPELRFCTPGRRWLRALVLGKERIQSVELVSGKHGHKGWIISFSGIDSVDKAKQIVGSTILVREDDRPMLEDGEFYTHDLVGMRVILKENGTLVGAVVNVVNYGSSDLLQVMVDTTEGVLKMSDSYKLEEGAHGSLVWIPFVEAIVPVVDIEKREMQITPPKGLLQLNLRSDLRSKKERSKLEWKEKKKFQQHVVAAKKKLAGMGQKHVLQGFSFGEKDEKDMLAKQIVDIDYNLFHYALNNINTCGRSNASKYLESELLLNKSTEISQKCLSSFPNDEKESEHFKLLTSGVDLLCDSKVCIVLVVGGGDNWVHGVQTAGASSGKAPQLCLMQELLNDDKFLKVHGERISAPLIIVSPANDIEHYQRLFLENDSFGFDVEKVRFLKEAKLPVLADQTTGRILLKSPCEILQSPVGSGGIFSRLSAHHIIDELHGWGVDYVQVCGLTDTSTVGHPMLLGLVKSKRSDIGFKISHGEFPHMEDGFDVVLSVQYLKEIIKDPGKIQLSAVPAEYEHVELVDGEWINICPTEPNCICLRSSIYSLLDTCSTDSVCILRTAAD